MNYYLAIDIGASSGRHIVGWRCGSEICTKEVYRFPNGVKHEGGSLVWDIHALYANVLAGIKEAFSLYPSISSLSIDTWGVDYVLLSGDTELLPVYAYRDSRTERTVPDVHGRIPFDELYSRTGCQFQPFNSIYQLCDDLERGRLDAATDMLMIPEYLMWRLTGVKAREYTNATTTGLVNAASGEFDTDIIDRLGYPRRLFPRLSATGTVLGRLRPELVLALGGDCNVVLCATHDTASAVEGIPMDGDHPYISSGTWSLLGVKTEHTITDEASRIANYSNEGGVGYNRYQKNIMGMWIVNELWREMCPDTPITDIVKMAEESTFDATLDANDPTLLSPTSMRRAFDELLPGFADAGDYFRCAYRSLAESYGRAVSELERNTGRTYGKLYIVGGGAKNGFLNRLTEEATGKEVVALPIEATALGNLKIQMETDK